MPSAFESFLTERSPVERAVIITSFFTPIIRNLGDEATVVTLDMLRVLRTASIGGLDAIPEPMKVRIEQMLAADPKITFDSMICDIMKQEPVV